MVAWNKLRQLFGLTIKSCHVASAIIKASMNLLSLGALVALLQET